MGWLAGNNWFWMILMGLLGALVTWFVTARKVTVTESRQAADFDASRTGSAGAGAAAIGGVGLAGAGAARAGRTPDPEPVEPAPAEPAPAGPRAFTAPAERATDVAEPVSPPTIAEPEPAPPVYEPAAASTGAYAAPSADEPDRLTDADPAAPADESDRLTTDADSAPSAADAGASAAGAGASGVPSQGSHGRGSVDPNPDGSSPDAAYAIKGNADSMLYHPTESPYYGRTRAEVWFDTEDNARAAGFTRWDEKDTAGGGARGLAAMPPQGAHGPGSVDPKPDGSSPHESYAIKGNADSMKFHTEASPYYGRTIAEVWFDTEDNARAAGFKGWND